MIDIDPRLDSKLRALYEHIEAQSSSRELPGFEVLGTTPRKRILSLIAGVASVAVVAAGVTVFATELHSRTVKPPAPAGSPSAVPPGLVSASELTAGLPAVSRIVIPVLRGSTGPEPGVAVAPAGSVGDGAGVVPLAQVQVSDLGVGVTHSVVAGMAPAAYWPHVSCLPVMASVKSPFTVISPRSWRRPEKIA